MKKFKILSRPALVKILLLILTFFLGAFTFRFYQKKKSPLPSPLIKDKHLAFVFEVYDLVQENYWEKIEDEQLVNIYLLALEKLTTQPQTLKKNDPEHLKKLLSLILAQIGAEDKKKEFVAQLSDLVLANLKPFGRSRLYTTKEEKELSKNVKNITDVNHYQALGIDKGASEQEIEKAHEKTIEKYQSPEDTQKLAQANQAYEILKEPKSKKAYDKSGIEPTISSKLLYPEIFYLKIKKFSPTTLEELARVTQEVDQGDLLNTLILDLRDNIGGAIDGLPYFLGPFIGNNQYAYQFSHQGESADFKTKTGWLPSLIRYKKVVVLINENTQSSAEVMAATLKRYNVGVVIGTASKGWGTVERVFQLKNQLDENEKYSVFLVHSLTLRDDNQPIEDRGIDPLININDADWEKQLYDYFHYDKLTETIKEIL